MSSQVQLCNLALSRIGGSTITSLSDNTNSANLCNTFFDDLADEVMAEGSWTSTIRRAVLARTTTTPAFEFTYEFQLPVDPKCLKVLSINEDIPGTYEYKIEGDKLVTDSDAISIRYIARLTNTSDWDIFLQRAFVTRLAAELAYPLTGDKDKAKFEFDRYQLQVAEGLALNNQQGSKSMVVANDLIEVR